MTARSLVLLLTATIDPGQTILVARRDPLLRLRDYEQALGLWLSDSPIEKIVFCENSGFDLSSLKALAATRPHCVVEFVSFSGNETGATKGKGYSEAQMMKYAFDHSELLRTADVVVKCTGRFTLRNSAAVLKSMAAEEFDVMCSLKMYLTFSDSRFFAGTVPFFRDTLLQKTEMIDDNTRVYFEHALAAAAASVLSVRGRWRPFPVFPLIDGISGTKGSTMTQSAIVSIGKRAYTKFKNFVYRN